MVESGRPSPNTVSAIEYLERDSCAGFLPWAFSGDPTKSGGAATRLVVAKTERTVNARQDMLCHRALTPVYAYVIGTAIANGDLPANDNWTKVNWVTPRRISVDAGREASANQKDIEMGLKTLSDHYAELGADFRQEVRRRAADAKLINDTATEFGVPPSSIFAPANTPLADINQAAANGGSPGPGATDFQPLFDGEPS